MSQVATKEEELVQFSHELEKTIQEVVSDLDPLDEADFDPVGYINSIFPDERSLTYAKHESADPAQAKKRRPHHRLDMRLQTVKRDMTLVSDSISKSVRAHSVQRVQTKQAVGDAKHSIGALFDKIKAIKDKAEKSERMVQEICRDIKSLDHAKTHLTTTISALMKLHMLVQAVDMLMYMSEKKQYKEVANRLGAVDMLFNDFADFNHIPKIANLRTKMVKERSKLQSQILSEFQSYGPNPSVGLDDMVAMLREGCLVIQALGPKAKDELLIWFSRSKLGPYTGIFGPGKPAAELRQTDRRYAWLRRTLREYDEQFGSIFPKSWGVPAVLSRDFCLLTKDHLRSVLKAQHSTMDINALVAALQKTIAFENELQMRYGNVDDAVDASVDATAKGGMDANAIKMRYRQDAKGNPVASTGVKMEFRKLVSAVFYPYLGQYVQLERENIAKLLSQVEKEEEWDGGGAIDEKEGNADRRTLSCSEKYFIYIKKSLQRCSRLTTGAILFEIAGEYQKGLRDLAAMLTAKLPKKPDNAYSLTKTDNITCTLIANTAEECKEIIPGIAEAIQKVIDTKFQDEVDFSNEQSDFASLANTAVDAIVKGFNFRLGKCLQIMAKINWGQWEQVGDQSEYVTQINSMLSQYAPMVCKMLGDKYHLYFCNRLAQTCIPLYEEAIFKCRRVNTLGAQQLALDSHALKSVFLSVPNLRGDKISERRTRAFRRIVDREMGKVVAIVKTLASPLDCLIATFKTLMPKGQESTHSETLTKVLYLKGLAKKEMQALVDSYNANVEPKEHVALDTKADSKFKRIFKFGSS
mmetsp:Transcript_27711/g.53901  ORF Transcript_27711/g.53901 Transcript_27711/m.53901 type:complete len:809 (-) Transcript_27711:186-2612(-)